jgi:hypothetical protein
VRWGAARGLAEEEVTWGEKGATVSRRGFYSGAAGWGMHCGRHHAAMRGAGGAWGQRGGQAARCGRQWPGRGARGWCTCEWRATSSETGEDGA